MCFVFSHQSHVGSVTWRVPVLSGEEMPSLGRGLGRLFWMCLAVSAVVVLSLRPNGSLPRHTASTPSYLRPTTPFPLETTSATFRRAPSSEYLAVSGLFTLIGRAGEEIATSPWFSCHDRPSWTTGLGPSACLKLMLTSCRGSDALSQVRIFRASLVSFILLTLEGFLFLVPWAITESFGTAVLCLSRHLLALIKWRHDWWRHHNKSCNLCVDYQNAIFRKTATIFV